MVAPSEKAKGPVFPGRFSQQVADVVRAFGNNVHPQDADPAQTVHPVRVHTTLKEAPKWLLTPCPLLRDAGSAGGFCNLSPKSPKLYSGIK